MFIYQGHIIGGFIDLLGYSVRGFVHLSEVGIYKRLQESKKTRTRPRKRSRKQKKQELDQEKIKKSRKQELNQESDQAKRKTFFFLDHFLGQVLVFLSSYFLVFFYKFPPLFKLYHY